MRSRLPRSRSSRKTGSTRTPKPFRSVGKERAQVARRVPARPGFRRFPSGNARRHVDRLRSAGRLGVRRKELTTVGLRFPSTDVGRRVLTLPRRRRRRRNACVRRPTGTYGAARRVGNKIAWL